MAEKYFVIVDRRHVRIYREETAPGQITPRLSVAHAVDLVDGHGNYWDNDTDQAGRFQGSKGRPAGMSIDERLPMQEERERRIVDQLATTIEKFFAARPAAVWHFAAGPMLHNNVLEQLTPPVRERLDRSVQKELANVPTAELRGHFKLAPVTAR